MVIAKSAPHIYISALPFAPISSHICRHYFSEFPNTLSVKRGRLSDWPALEMVIPVDGIWISSVAFSPDGQRIVSGSADHTIRVWNATTGAMEGSPFTGHTGSVNSVAFSQDEQRIVSGSDDGTIRVWNATTGAMEGKPFTGHTSSVNSVAFSQDEQRIVSGSFDGTIRVWNAATGELEGSPFTGHTGWVNSEQIVSGSDEGTICAWNSNATEMDIAKQVDFTNQSEINSEGWICGNEGELLIWIPDIHRLSLCRPSNIWIAGGRETQLDLSSFVHGPNWATCLHS